LLKLIEIAVAHTDLGNIIGTSRKSTNRQLRLWEHNKWVRLERGGIDNLSAEAPEGIC